MLKSDKAQKIVEYILSEPASSPITVVMGALLISRSIGEPLEWRRIDTEEYAAAANRFVELGAIVRAGENGEFVMIEPDGLEAWCAVIVLPASELLDTTTIQQVFPDGVIPYE
ncbi:MAG: hypothetical protein WBP12_03880 [Candidatus Saccharimonas sp.]